MSEHTIRRGNLLRLYTQFVADAQQADPAASIVGLDRAFARKLQIANTSFSSYKSGARPIGVRIARQVEAALTLEQGWMDSDHETQEMSQDQVALDRFVKLATRAFKRADSGERLRLIALLRQSLAGLPENQAPLSVRRLSERR